MSVPDWPTTYGYNMFLFPVSRWVGGILYEHTHRLFASGVGILTLSLCVWILAVEKRRWVRLLGILAFISIVLQGVLGGLRVTLNANTMGVFHGMIAQFFLSLLGILTLVTSPWFLSGSYRVFRSPQGLKWIALGITALIFIQLMVATSMRHAHIGLAIRDFPTAYGKWWPPMDTISIAQINRRRAVEGQVATSAVQIALQMLHRILAVVIFGSSILFVGLSRKTSMVQFFGGAWVLLMGIQIILGAWTIWSNKAADIATAHMAIGALLLFLGVQLTFLMFFSLKTEKNQCLATTHQMPDVQLLA